jgi:transcriptional regulator with XRE-family HTH domain
MYDLGKNFKKVRAEKRLTQKQIAEGIGIAERQYQYYEYGKKIPSALVLCNLADFLNLPLDYLVGREFPQPDPTGDKSG